MNRFIFTRWLSCAVASVCLLAAGLPSADADDLCSERKVKRLAKSGKTVAYIAKSCEMSTEDVRDILEEEESEPSTEQSRGQKPSRGGIPSGTPLAPCACWGFVSPGHRQATPACSSGVAVATLCPQLCPAGGYAWRGVCE